MNLSEIEQKILKFWDKKKIFPKSVRQRKDRPYFTFYDGPPFATGLPHYGHILATTIKDSVTRYWAMRGYRVERRVGWDCHGLPVENMIEKELGLKSKRDIEKLGVDKFNKACETSVFRCVKDFETTLKRVGRWADYSNAYATMDREYIESVWWVFKKLYDQGLVYQDYRVTPYCPRCGTPLSNFELNQPGAYRDVEDQSVFIKFPIKGEIGSFFLVWTTTPWTLPANTALAVGEAINYAKVKVGEEKYILAKDLLKNLDADYEIETEFLGGALVGREYEPLYEMKLDKPGYRVAAADFVSMEEGTGIVHIAPSFGEEDFELGKKENLPAIVTIDLDGKVKKELNIPGEGKPAKAADEDIKADLKKRKLLYKEAKITHSYPFCWRCDTALLYYPLSTWYVAVTKFREQLVKNNEQIRWVPLHLKHGRFGKWLEGARDWAISRNRFWGAPIPIWKCEKCGQIKVVGSLKELGKKIKNLHRPYIDEIKLKCTNCEGEMARTEEVFDCWFESGAMPYAQWHYPFENKKLVEETFPADFIAEGLDQTRGWFYTLHVLATALTTQNIGLGVSKPAFRNVVVNGLILAEDGRKLSKRLKNYTDLEVIFEKYGADSLRFFLLASTPIGEDYYVSDRRIEDTYRQTISTLWHSFSFFKTYISRNFKPQKTAKPQNSLDAWIISRLNNTIKEMTKAMDNYELTDGARLFIRLVDDMSNWYVRRARRRFQKPETKADKLEAAQTLYALLLNTAKLAAPFIPFLAEEIYLGLKKAKMAESVHLCDYPKADAKLINADLEEKMDKVREITGKGLAARAAAGIKVRQPLSELTIKMQPGYFNEELKELIKKEVNIRKLTLDPDAKKELELNTKITAELEEEGVARELIRHIQDMRKAARLAPRDRIWIKTETKEEDLLKLLKKFEHSILTETSGQKLNNIPEDAIFRLHKEIKLAGQKVLLSIKRLR